jgi:hypothetical protein
MPGTHWTDEEVQSVMEQAHRGLGPSEIFVKGKTTHAIGVKLRRMNMGGDGIQRTKWLAEHEAILVDLASQGISARQIVKGNLLPYNLNAISKKMSRMKLGKTVKVRRLPAMILDILEKFLQENWAGNTPEELASAWNKIYPKFPVTYRLMAYHLDKLNLKVPYFEVHKIRVQKEFEAKCRAEGKYNEIRLNRIRIMKDRFEQKLDIWTGLPLDKLMAFSPYAPEVEEPVEIIDTEELEKIPA